MKLFGWFRGLVRKKPAKAAPSKAVVPKKPAAMATTIRPSEQKKAEGKRLVAVEVSDEMERAKAMAQKAVQWAPFVEACKAHGYADPTKAFLDFYATVKDNPKIWKMEAAVEEKVEEKGQYFSRTGFYAGLFIKMTKKQKP